MTGCDFPIDFHEFVRSLFPGDVVAGWATFASSVLDSSRGRRGSCAELSGAASRVELSTSLSLWRMSSSIVFRGM
jgi:hypothetical protein